MTFDEWFLDNFKPHTWMFSKESIQKAFEDGVAEGLKQQVKHEWIGLTYEELVVLNHQSYAPQIGLLPLTFYEAIEAKLKEKNT